MSSPELRSLIRDVPDFPKPGIIFKDITPLLADGPALRAAVDGLAEPFRGRVDTVLGVESRGFILGAAVAYALRVGLAIVRKPGKLPAAKRATTYELEYGSDSLEIHQDAIGHGHGVLLVDDLLATGGTAAAAIDLVRQLNGQLVACSFLIELSFLKGRDRLQPVPVHSLIQYAAE
ncbi:MAG TPA: adenine phosphoribosyltransferase [Candidatus Bathyarchaeia archaeon]|nr:adenine phosphoribosyltransferase [Candidatus Bathyarchaeia archaeon]